MELLLFGSFFIVALAFFISGKDDFGRRGSYIKEEVKEEEVKEEEVKEEEVKEKEEKEEVKGDSSSNNQSEQN